MRCRRAWTTLAGSDGLSSSGLVQRATRARPGGESAPERIVYDKGKMVGDGAGQERDTRPHPERGGATRAP